MRVWGIAAQNDSLFQYLTDKFKVINESDSVFHEDVNNLMILYYGYAYRDSYGHMPVTEIKINQLLQQGKTEDAFDLCEKTLEQAPAYPDIGGQSGTKTRHQILQRARLLLRTVFHLPFGHALAG